MRGRCRRAAAEQQQQRQQQRDGGHGAAGQGRESPDHMSAESRGVCVCLGGEPELFMH